MEANKDVLEAFQLGFKKAKALAINCAAHYWHNDDTLCNQRNHAKEIAKSIGRIPVPDLASEFMDQTKEQSKAKTSNLESPGNIVPPHSLPTGWICPMCGKVNAPSNRQCTCSPPDYIPMPTPYYPPPTYPYAPPWWQDPVWGGTFVCWR